MSKTIIAVVLVVVGGAAVALGPFTRSHAVQKMQQELDHVVDAIEEQHTRASEDLKYALTHSAVQGYFELAETRKGNVYKDGVLQFTNAQRFYKNHVDSWINAVMKPFKVGEACLIDASGQEHARITHGQVAPDRELSAAESSASFFNESVALQPGEVHVNYPYMSADLHQWVFSYTSPVQLQDGSKPAFLHFELPISYFQELTTRSVDRRVVVIDPKGFLIADSDQPIAIDRRATAHTHADDETGLASYMPAVSTVSASPSFTSLVNEMYLHESGTGVYQDGDHTYHLVYRRLPTFDWVIAEIQDEDQLLEGGVISYWLQPHP